jgi:hypothetical protein
VVSADALVPCYKSSISVNLNEKPTVATVGADQKKLHVNKYFFGW